MSYPISITCATCRENEIIVTNTIHETKVFTYMDGDAGLGILVSAVVDCYVEYTNCYKYFDTFAYDPYDYPTFASFYSFVVSYAERPLNCPDIICASYRDVNYYDSSGTLLRTQTMTWNVENDSYPSNPSVIFGLNTRPAYTLTGATFSMPSTGVYSNIDIKTYFS